MRFVLVFLSAVVAAVVAYTSFRDANKDTDVLVRGQLRVSSNRLHLFVFLVLEAYLCASFVPSHAFFVEGDGEVSIRMHIKVALLVAGA